MDLSTFKEPTSGGAKHCVLFVDSISRFQKTYLLKLKSELWKVGMIFLEEMVKKHDFKVEVLRCDNVGESKSFQ